MSIGREATCSQYTKPPSTASPPAPTPSTGAEVHPRPGASMTAHSVMVSPAMDRPEPTRSGGRATGSLESGSSGTDSSSASTTIGTLTRNTEPHQKCASSRPPTIGPSARPTPEVAAQMPKARCRSRLSGNMFPMMDSVDGLISAAPMPIEARAAISAPIEPARAAQVDPARKNTSPARNVRLRPNRSASEPATSSRPAKTSTYASVTHCNWLVVACNCRTSAGRTTLRMVLSSVTTSNARHSTPRFTQRRADGAGCAGPSLGSDTRPSQLGGRRF